MSYRRLEFALAAAVLAFAWGPASAQMVYPNFDDNILCLDAVNRKLADFGVRRDDVQSLLAERHFSTSDYGDVYLGWTVWADLKSCDGSLAIRLSEQCDFRTAYTTGACRIRGVYPSD